MHESSCPRSRPGIAPARFAIAATLLAAGCLGGCAPAEYGSFDMEKSKAVAAEKGIGPQGNAPPAKKASRPTGPPSAPVPK